MKYIQSFKKYVLNEAALGQPMVDLLKSASIDSTKMNDYFEANKFLSNFISDNQEELSEANGNEVIDALEPWYDRWHEDWEQTEEPTATEIETGDSFETDDIDDDIEDFSEFTREETTDTETGDLEDVFDDK